MTNITKYCYRYEYYDKYLQFTRKINTKCHNIYNIKRYDYFNFYPKYLYKDNNENDKKNIFSYEPKIIKPIKTEIITNKETINTKDLFIKGTSITKDIFPKNLSPNPSVKSTGMNTINFLDLLLPSFEQKLPTKKEEEKTLIPKLEFTEEEKSFDYERLDFKLDNIDDLITLGEKYEEEYKPRNKRFSINLRVLSEMVEPLKNLSSMVGMEKIKEAIYDKIILFLQGLDNKNQDFQHIAIYGGPGMGKTEVAKLIGKIYAKMGILSKGDFKEIKLTDLKSGYVGQSEIKTQKLLEDAHGCVLFFDEAYSLGSDDKIDSYSQGILDLINLYLDKYKNDFIMIIAGYKEDLNNRFFKANQGLKSRFGLILELDDYSGDELKKIFIKKVKDYNWKIVETDIKACFFEENKKYFKYYGRDISNLFSKCKISHAKRVLYAEPEQKKIINKDDLIAGFNIYKKELLIEGSTIDKAFENEIKYSMYS